MLEAYLCAHEDETMHPQIRAAFAAALSEFAPPQAHAIHDAIEREASARHTRTRKMVTDAKRIVSVHVLCVCVHRPAGPDFPHTHPFPQAKQDERNQRILGLARRVQKGELGHSLKLSIQHSGAAEMG